MARKTKIVATLGPASEDRIDELADAGVNVFRQNFSHGTHEEHEAMLERVREHERAAAMLDTQGPEARIRNISEAIVLESGDSIMVSTAAEGSNAEQLAVDYEGFLENVAVDDRVVIGDGNIELTVTDVSDDTATCDVLYGGELSQEKTINVPGKDVIPSGLTEQDREDIVFGAEHGFDFVAVSFVKEAQDVEDVRDLLEEHGSDANIIAKIEHGKAVDNFDEILDAADGIMVARGDLAVEMPAAEVPVIQKRLIQQCNEAAKPVIVATQMLQSMTEHPHATRAELSDVANAVEDNADAVMLSAETTIGDYPVKSVEVMADIVTQMETYRQDDIPDTLKTPADGVEEVISKSIWQAAKDVDAAYIVAHTYSGATARHIAKYRPQTPIVAFTASETVKRQMSLVWGVEGYSIPDEAGVEAMMQASVSHLSADGKVTPDDTVIMSAGVPLSVAGTTNRMDIRQVKNILD